MFGKLKDRLKSWTKKISKEKKAEEKPEKIVETKKAKIKPKEKSPSKPIESKLPLPQKEVITTPKEKPEETKEIPIPTKFNVATQKYEPDLEKLEEAVKEIKVEETIEEIKTQDKAEKSIFKKISSSFSKTKISEQDFEKYSEELEMLLLENNVALEVSEKIIQELKNKIVEQEIPKKDLEEEINKALKEIIEEILIEPFDLIKKIKQKKEPYVILFCGINGGGKTTTIAKLANKLKKQKISCIMAAADTFRAAAIDQIKKHGENLKIKVIAHEYETDPASVGFDAIKYAKKNRIKVVLIDTAGRIHTSKNLMAEIEKINNVCKPDTKFFIGESITGNDSVEQVKSFDQAVNVDGIILTKSDIDEKGGTALSVGYVTKKPIIYLGTGQEYDKLEKFDKKKFIEKLGL